MKLGFVHHKLKEESSDKIYFWQLYDIIGEAKLQDIITTFYTNVLNDQEDELFRNTFKDSGTLEHHVKKQTNFWADAMGGGKRYPGGEARLEVHHDSAKAIMTQQGADRWLYHMNTALDTHTFEDERITPCIKEFIDFFMNRYGQTYNFKSKL